MLSAAAKAAGHWEWEQGSQPSESAILIVMRGVKSKALPRLRLQHVNSRCSSNYFWCM
jgi:hypothetical protein